MSMAPDRIPHTVTYTFQYVTKRDGRIQSFDMERIEQAVYKNFLETGEAGIEEARVVAHFVGDLLEQEAEMNGGDLYTPNVEHIQDLVEQELMKQGYFNSAKAYILFRQRRADLRRERKEKLLADISASNLSVILRDGSYARFNIEEIYNFAEQCAQGFPAVDVHEIVESLKLNIFDGISLSEINEALVLVAKSRVERDPQYSYYASRIMINEMNKRVIGVNEFDADFETIFKTSFEKQIRLGVAQGRYSQALLDFDFTALSAELDASRDKLFEYRGIHVLWDRYLIKTLDQEFLEIPQYFWMRIAMGLAIGEKDKNQEAIASYHLMSQMFYTPSSPTLIHAGQERAQMSSCFLSTVEDDLHHIFKVVGDSAQISKYSGGLSIDWTNIRATNSLVKSINQPSQGLIPFLKVVDSTTAAINRSGKRRSAVSVSIENWHLDFEYFLDLRKNTGDDRRRTHDINTIAWISDLFMKRVEAGAEWTLFSPNDVPDLHDAYGKDFEARYEAYEKLVDEGKIKLFKRLEAKVLWRKMITMLFETGHPWITFKDPSNIRSPQDHVGVIHHTNLCTEIMLNTSANETAVCNLGSISLQRHLDANNNIDWNRLAQTVAMGMRMIDNVIDVNFYPTIEGENANKRHRPVGLGVMGYQDLLFKKHIPFDTDEAVALSDEIMEFISYHAILTSSQLAKEKGAYSSFAGSKWDRGLLPIDTIALLEEERGISTNISKTGKLDWTPVREHIKAYGMRNSLCMAIAPTATIGNISASLPSIEPIYENIYVKANFSGEFTVINEYLVNDLKAIGMWNDHMLSQLKHHNGSIQNIVGIPENMKELYKEVFQIGPEWLITHAAHRQKWIDQAQSINIFTKSTSGKALSDIYFKAWKSGLKTTYYLRTLGATSIEKATTDIKESTIAMPEEKEEKIEEITIQQTSILEHIDLPAVAAPDMGTGKKLHVYNDGTCESCQ